MSTFSCLDHKISASVPDTCIYRSASAPRCPKTFLVSSAFIREASPHRGILSGACAEGAEGFRTSGTSSGHRQDKSPKVSGSSFPRPNFGLDQNLDAEIFLSPEGAETPGHV